MLHRCKKWSDIFKVTALFASMEHWPKCFWSDFEKMVYYRNHRPACLEDADYCKMLFFKHKCLVTLTLFNLPNMKQGGGNSRPFPYTCVYYGITIWGRLENNAAMSIRNRPIEE